MSRYRNAAVASTISRIRDPQAYEEGQWDLDIFDGCFGDTKIKPSDMDGVFAAVCNDTMSAVERRGSVLFMEFKSPGKSVPLGQDLMYRTLSQPKAQFVIVVQGPRNVPQSYCFWTPSGPGKWTPCDLQSLRTRVTEWWEWANGPWGDAA